MTDKNKKTDLFLEQRRDLLKLGAAGMPMVLTLRASAQEAVISQLRCTITIPSKFKILVDDTGAAWVGSGKLRTDKKTGNLKDKDVKNFKHDASYIFPHDSVSASYRPDACEYETCDESGGSGDHDDLLSHLTDENGTYAMNDYLAGSGEDDGHDHSCDDDGHAQDSHGHSIITNAPCGYAVYEYSRSQIISPGDYVTQGGDWNLSGDDGLYLELSLKYIDENGVNGHWPGVSCVISILNYMGH